MGVGAADVGIGVVRAGTGDSVSGVGAAVGTVGAVVVVIASHHELESLHEQSGLLVHVVWSVMEKHAAEGSMVVDGDNGAPVVLAVGAIVMGVGAAVDDVGAVDVVKALHH